MKLPALALAAFLLVPGCGGPSDPEGMDPAGDGTFNPNLMPMVPQTRDVVNGLNVVEHFGKLGRNPAPEIAWYRNCTVRYTRATRGRDQARYSGRVLIHLHRDTRTKKSYYRHFDQAWFYCDSATLFIRDGGKIVERLYMRGNVLFYADTPAWSPRVSDAAYFIDDDRYQTENGIPLHRYAITVPFKIQTGGGHGAGTGEDR